MFVANNGFSIPNSDKYITIESKQSHSFDVSFDPSQPKQYVQDIKLKIQNNSFENTTIQAIGEGYASDITVEGLPIESEDELRFGESPVGKILRKITFLRFRCTS
jgi:hydrocephalus-inducing protein